VIPGLRYIVVYRIRETEDSIFVDAVFHGAQEEQRNERRL
jgi:plasmid stabilization system protein ParE